MTWCDINLTWDKVKEIRVSKMKGDNERTVTINGEKFTGTSLRKRRAFVSGTRVHIFGIDFIIKVDCPNKYAREGMYKTYRQSDKEYRLYQIIEEDDRQYFPELLSYEKGSYIAFRRYEKIHKFSNSVPAQKNFDIVSRLVDKYDLSDLETMRDYCTNSHDLLNWAMVDRKPMIYDYGF